MKKRITIVVAVIIFCIAVAAQSDVLTGPVSMVEKWVYKTEIRFGEVAEIWDSHSTKKYDIEGNVIEEAQYSSSGALTERTVHSYDSNFCKTESVYYTGWGVIDRRIERQFDSAGREIQIEVYDGNGRLTYRSFVEYEGNLKRSRTYEADGTLSLAIDEETDSFGNAVRWVSYDEDTGNLESVIRFTYASDRKVLSNLMYNEDEELIAELRYSYSYDEDGMDEITTSDFYIGGTLYKSTTTGTVVETDSFGNWTETRNYKQEERFGQPEWLLSDIERRSITYR